VLIVIGQTLFVVGVHQRSFLLVLLGRGIFGCGGENLDLAQSVIVYRWFSGKELSMAFGMNSMTSLMGSVLNDNIEPVAVEYFGITNGLILGLFVCLLSLGCTILVIFLDKCRDKSLKAPESESFDLKNISKFNPMFFFLLIYTICMDCSIYCFSYIASGFLQERFGYSSVEAGSLMSVSFLVSSLLSPFFGILADKHGKRALMLIVADLLVFFFHIFFMVCDDQTTTIHIASAFTALGIGFAIYMTVFWTTLAYVVKKEIVGTAYGVCYAVCNLALAVCPVVVGVIERETVRDWGYFWVNGFLGLLAFLGALAAYAVYDLDLKSGGLLEKVDSLNINLKSS
jgi:nitrate/nitrite transporter NarK